jgi:hypothetical protein
MFFVGIQGMNRRVADYPEVIAGGNDRALLLSP